MNEDDPIKHEGARRLTTLNIDFSDAQGQITLQSMVGSGLISNLSETLCMFSFPAKMKKTRSKMKVIECSQHYTPSFQRLKGR